MSPLAELKQRFRAALAGLADNTDELVELVRRSQDPKFGDYQANVAMPLGKRLKRPPRDVATEILARLKIDDLCEPPEIAGPGFINLRIRDEWLAAALQKAVGDERLGVPLVASPKTYVLDYSAPNVAKPMHVGHIRSTVIGTALDRTLRFLGHRVISDNHIGDWGTQFGMIIYGYRNFLDAAAYATDPIPELARVYRIVRQLMDVQAVRKPAAEADAAEDAESDDAPAAGQSEIAQLSSAHPNINAAVLAETAKLHHGDAENRHLWQDVMRLCLTMIDNVYQRLDVRFDHTLGESFYEDLLPGVVDELLRRGLARESEGAICVFVEGQKTPMIVRKQDGAFLYATTDLATIGYRMKQWRPDAILYVVDHRQSLHFQQLFATAAKLGYDNVEFQHISFGTVLGEDGRPFKTRSGALLGLEMLLDEAVAQAARIVAENPEVPPERQAAVAEAVGIAAIKYADLSQNRTSDYVFSFEKMLAMNGNTATYMQYAYARVRSIFAKGGVDVAALRTSGTPILLTTPAERALAVELTRFAEALELTVADYRPNQLTGYLFELANRYSTFFEKCPVLKAESPELKQSRLLLCDLTARAIQKGLELLGIKVVEKM